MWEYVFLGILQGIFEWLPVSSEGIVALSGDVLSIGQNPVDVALFLHLGTLMAVVVYFRKEWVDVLRNREPELLRFLAISTVVSLAVAFPIYTVVREVAMGPALLMVIGLGLLATSYFHGTGKRLGLGMDRTSLVAGLLQGLAVIPGLSRSGSTIFGISLGDVHPAKILRYSYMMSVPVVLASGIYLTLRNPLIVSGWPSLVSSFLVGLASLHFLMRLSRKIDFRWFTLLFGLLCIAGATIGFAF